jgi:large subunit ribosomal protein L9
MKVILVRDVAKIGRRNQIIDVPDGYAQNKLIPQKLALPATPQNLKRVEALHAGIVASKDAKEEAFLDAVKKLKQRTVHIPVEANSQGHLFKAIHEKDIIAAAEAVGAKLDVSSVKIPSQIKSVGTHTINLVHGAHIVPYSIIIARI